MELPKIKIENFEGPFDLLLHLIKKNKMSIYNIKIYEITNQYLDYLNQMKEMNLDITSEFIVIAATLIEIKSKYLLPKIKKEDDDEDEEDVEKALLEKLALYKKIKNISVFFKNRYSSCGDIYTKKPEIIEPSKKTEDNSDILKGLNFLDLYNIYNNLLEIYINRQNKNSIISKKIYMDKYKIGDEINYIKEKISTGKIYDFRQLIDKSECKMETIVIFLAFLQLIKDKMIKVYQRESFGDILIERRNINE
ncbi:segregation/condensation protein A [Clostridium sp. BJN0001]|uniref:segregation/condensation protein A n=1 Tax=Clostridium sp. BJN0001 TaxID=2930219 RepID=UPI001FD2CBF0|nr:segregation/condensation protein A [Clostridium sp. BJN0001]